MNDSTPDERGPDIDYAEILKRIPHRYPMLLIDRAEDYRPQTSIVGIKNVTHNEPFFQGHFPENPVMPGVLIVEALGQAGGVLMSKSLDADTTGRTIFFTSIAEAKFRSPVRPGDTLQLRVQVLRHRGDLFKFKGVAVVGERIAAETEFSALVV